MRASASLTVLLALPLLMAADAPEGPKSPAARSALTRYSIEVKRIDDEAARAKAKAAKELVDSLKVAQGVALKAGNLAEANALQVEIDRMEMIPGRPLRVAVDSRKDWQQGVNVAAGSSYSLTAEGSWCWATAARARSTCDANGTGQGYGQLEGRIAGGKPFQVGKSMDLTATESGLLELRMADPGRDDNDGKLFVTIVMTK